MRAAAFFTTLALGAGLVTGIATLSPAFAQSSGEPGTTTSGPRWLSIPQIHDRLMAAGYRDIDEIEREDRYYEVKATDPDGRRVELEVDPTSGAVTDTEFKDRGRGPSSRSEHRGAD